MFFCREFYKLATKRPRVNTPKAKNVANRLSTQLEQHPRSNAFNGITNEINPPEVLTHHDSIDPRQSRQRDKKQGNRKLNLSGDVDLGTNSLKENRRKKLPKKYKSTARMTTTSTTTTERSNDLPIYPPRMNHHRHHHNEHHQERQQEFIVPETTTPREFITTTTTTTTTTPRPTTTTPRPTTTPTTTTSTTTTTTPRPRPTPTTTTEAYEPETTTTRRPQPTTTTPEPYYEPTTLSTTTTKRADEQETTTLSIRAQKAARIAKLRERLANLSPEDQKEYIRMKLLRSQEKKQQNETNP